jgi:hypothetical protein
MTITTAYQPVFVGSTANDGTGDDLRSAFEKVNSAFGYMGNSVINAVNIDASGIVEAGSFKGDGSALTNLNIPVAAVIPSYSGNIANLTVKGNLSASNAEFTFAEFNGNVVFDGNYIPTANTSPGKIGQFAFDSGNIYICVGDNTWKRAALTSTF